MSKSFVADWWDPGDHDHQALFLGNCCCTGGSCTYTVGGVCLPEICVFPPLFISIPVPQFPQQFNSCGICVRCRIRGSHRLEAFLPLFTSTAQPPDLPMQNILTGHTTLKLCFINPKKGTSDHFYQLTWTQYSHLAAGLRGAWAPSQAWDENTFSTSLICIIILVFVWKFDEPH